MPDGSDSVQLQAWKVLVCLAFPLGGKLRAIQIQEVSRNTNVTNLKGQERGLFRFS